MLEVFPGERGVPSRVKTPHLPGKAFLGLGGETNDGEKMEATGNTKKTRQSSPFNLGTFGGYSFRDHAPFRHRLSAEEVLNWDEAKDGSAWFWPRGDHFGIAMVVGTAPSISPRDLRTVIEIVQTLGGDTVENWLRIFYTIRDDEKLDLQNLEPHEVRDREAYVFDRPVETSSATLFRQAAVEVMRRRYPDAYQFLMAHHDEGFLFQPEKFLNSKDWFIQESETESRRRVLIVISRHVRY